jgi:hypothetical protein
MVRRLQTFEVHDLPQDTRYLWTGIGNYVKPNPLTLSAHTFRVRPNIMCTIFGSPIDGFAKPKGESTVDSAKG